MSDFALMALAWLVSVTGGLVVVAACLWVAEWAVEQIAKSWRHWPALLHAYLDVRRNELGRSCLCYTCQRCRPERKRMDPARMVDP